MNTKKTAFVITLIIIVGSLSSCSFLSGNPMNKIVRPPRLEGEKQALQLAFEESVGNNVLLKSPAKGKFLSSFVTYDVDGDEEEEAFVFYVDPAADASVRVNILDKMKGDWTSVADLKGSGSSVYEIEFEDVNLDGNSEIIISWSLFDNKTTRIVSVIDFTVSDTGTLTFTARANEYFTYKELIDFDLNGYYELCVLHIDNTTEVLQPYLKVFEFTENNSVKLISELLLDPNTAAVSKTRKDIISSDGNDTARLFIDLLRSDFGLFTEVVVWSKKDSKLIRMLKNPANDTFREISLNTSDIDGDGLYEIPVIAELAGSLQKKLLSGSEETNDASYIHLIRWVSLKGAQLKNKKLTIYNPEALYLFGYNWKTNNVTVRYDQESKDVIFSKWNLKTKKYGDDLFALNYSSDVTKVLKGYTLAASGENGNYWCKIYPAGSSYGITADYISENIIPI
ncbi:MAG: hypothetical protein BWY46_00057 [Firmicutes bacterium ADurb.Bin300]|nr:MAG: hypothetical protein BWY46_00057 [Firmicutes bacterium ADurb.Bin300]